MRYIQCQPHGNRNRCSPHSLLPTPCSLLPTPYSLLPTPYSLFPVPYSLFPQAKIGTDGSATDTRTRFPTGN
ncbi:hypothetical protein [Moorena producens]|uniref:hypothetical protein n=1 Tax=Moorena producens TaxID=1155739 RepID=UPI0009F2EA3A|nr:hypothetical protein [Moorena producens]